MSQQPNDPVLEITRSILTEATQRPWLAALLMRRKPDWLTRLAHLAQRVRNLPRHTRRALRRKLASGLAAAALLLALAGPPQTVYADSITVNGTCTLADAITSANTDTATGSCAKGNGADIITLTADVSLTAALPDITSDITIQGGGHTIAGNNTNFRVLHIVSGIVTLNQATISGGHIIAGNGGGILNQGTLTVNNSTITGNLAKYGGGLGNIFGGTLTVTNSTISGGSALRGGGIYNGGILKAQNSTISGNSATQNGGGINSYGLLTVQSTTLSGNTSAQNGGGISTGTITTLQDITVSGNTATQKGGGISNGGTITMYNSTVSGNTAASGSGIYNRDTLMIQNSIVALQSSGVDCYNNVAPITSQGYNIESGTSCGFASTGDQQNKDNTALKLLPLANNGGPTWTHALDNGSVALEQIPASTNGCGTTITTDQRGYARPGTRNNQTAKMCEVGAWEAQLADPTAITLRDLMATANSSPGLIGAAGAALAALGAWVIRQRRVAARQRLNH